MIFIPTKNTINFSVSLQKFFPKLTIVDKSLVKHQESIKLFHKSIVFSFNLILALLFYF